MKVGANRDFFFLTRFLKFKTKIYIEKSGRLFEQFDYHPKSGSNSHSWPSPFYLSHGLSFSCNINWHVSGALNTKNEEIVRNALIVLQNLIVSDSAIGKELVCYYKYILPSLRLLANKKGKNLL